ncbi:MAG: RsmE family RNA methyltransferase [Verrucomicrobiota bacterium]|nr:RsmE family RNA methyltransferase [Verrucomicrobiota bacterium]
MHRFYLPPQEVIDGKLTLDERESHHAATVLRIHKGEHVAVLDGNGTEYMCEAVVVNKRATTLMVRHQNAIAPLPYSITLLQAITKGRSMDFIIQKATELCVHRIVPLAAGRSIVRVENPKPKMEKWQTIAIESIKQCGCPWMPIIEAPITPREFLARDEQFDLSMMASLQGNTRHPREYITDHVQKQNRLPRSLAVWIGPEGDFSPSEANDILSSGIYPITLGRVILRSETAALYSLSVLNYEMQAPRS